MLITVLLVKPMGIEVIFILRLNDCKALAPESTLHVLLVDMLGVRR